jgi:hypothetical protein
VGSGAALGGATAEPVGGGGLSAGGLAGVVVVSAAVGASLTGLLQAKKGQGGPGGDSDGQKDSHGRISRRLNQ